MNMFLGGKVYTAPIVFFAYKSKHYNAESMTYISLN